MTTAAPAVTSPWPATRLVEDEAGHSIALPSADARLRYAWRYWLARLASQSGPHRLRPGCNARYSADFTLSSPLRERWADLFDERRGPSGTRYAFLCAHSVITLLHSRIFADLGVNVAHVQLLQHVARTGDDPAAPARVGEQRVDCALSRVLRVGPTEVLAVIATRVTDDSGSLLADAEDSFLVRQLDVAYTVQADEDDALRRAVSRLRRHTAEIDVQDRSVRVRQLYLAPSVLVRFGRVAGEREAVPAVPVLSRLLRLRRPTVQRAYLRNLVVRELAEWGLELRNFQIVFGARARIGQTLRLLERGGAFELFDEADRLVAYGRA